MTNHLKNIDKEIYRILDKLTVEDIIVLYKSLGFKFSDEKNLTREELYLVVDEVLIKSK
jgi:hypothetical protein